MGNYLAHDPRAVDPVWALASGHWDFIAIHPCDDGNGRAARWIANRTALGYRHWSLRWSSGRITWCAIGD